MAAAGQVGAADRAAEQDVADMGEAHLLVEEHHAARLVTGAVKDVEAELADLDPVAFIEPAIRREIAYAGEAEPRAALDHVVQQQFVGEMRALDRHAARLAQLGRTADVIDMAVREPDLLDRDA